MGRKSIGHYQTDSVPRPNAVELEVAGFGENMWQPHGVSLAHGELSAADRVDEMTLHQFNSSRNQASKRGLCSVSEIAM